jgi:hypothetical protein
MWEILTRSRHPSDDDVFPYLYEGTIEEDYQVAISVEETDCCVNFYSELSTSKENINDDTLDLLTCEFAADDIDDANNVILHSPPKPTQLFPWDTPDIVRAEIYQRSKDNSLYLSPTMNRLHDSIE